MAEQQDAFRPQEYNAWAKKLLWPFNVPAACPLLGMDPESDATVEWIRAFQTEHGLRVDGWFGPTSVTVAAAVYEGGGIGGLIINGTEVDLGIPVARMPLYEGDPVSFPPRAMLLSIKQVERELRMRRTRERQLRSHFTIDAARGHAGASLIIQWADPAFSVPFSPAPRYGDYPREAPCIGIELENALTGHRREIEARKWRRSREYVVQNMGGRNIRSLSYHQEQIRSLKVLLEALHEGCGLALRFPEDDGGFRADASPEELGKFEGVIARFHLETGQGEPGAGLVSELKTLFPEQHARHPEPRPPASGPGRPRRRTSEPPTLMPPTSTRVGPTLPTPTGAMSTPTSAPQPRGFGPAGGAPSPAPSPAPPVGFGPPTSLAVAAPALAAPKGFGSSSPLPSSGPSRPTNRELAPRRAERSTGESTASSGGSVRRLPPPQSPLPSLSGPASPIRPIETQAAASGGLTPEAHRDKPAESLQRSTSTQTPTASGESAPIAKSDPSGARAAQPFRLSNALGRRRRRNQGAARARARMMAKRLGTQHE